MIEIPPKLRLRLNSWRNKTPKRDSLYHKSLLCRARVCVRACRNMTRALPHKQRLLCNLSSEEKQPGRSSHDAKFLHLHAGESSPAGPGGGRGAGAGEMRPELEPGPDGGSSRAGPGFLTPRAASFVPAPNSQFRGRDRRSRVPGGR